MRGPHRGRPKAKPSRSILRNSDPSPYASNPVVKSCDVRFRIEGSDHEFRLPSTGPFLVTYWASEIDGQHERQGTVVELTVSPGMARQIVHEMQMTLSQIDK